MLVDPTTVGLESGVGYLTIYCLFITMTYHPTIA
jgi:hypothetical protein